MPPPPALRIAALVSLGALLLSLIGSAFFWEERALFVDAGHIVFRIINDDSLQIQEGRIGAFITQGVPLIGARMGLPLNVILALYSLSFSLFYLLAGLLIYRVCSRYDLVILLAAYHFLLCTAGWYWTNNEVHQGVTWLLLTFALAQWSGRWSPTFAFVLFCGGLYLALFTHPLVVIPAISLWGIWLIRKDLPWGSKYWNIAASLALIGIGIWKFSISTTSGGYDSGKLLNVQNMKVIEVIQAFAKPVSVGFYSSLFTVYPGFLVLFIAGIYAAARSHRRWLLLWCLLCMIGHLILLSLTYGEFYRFYIESEWMGMAIPGIALLLYRGKWAQWRPARVAQVASLIVVVQLVLVGLQFEPFHNRLVVSKRLLTLMRERGLHKAAIPELGTYSESTYLMTWDAPVHSQILSALHGDKPQLTFLFTRNEEERQQKIRLGKDSAWECFVPRAWGKYNPRYFSIDTTTTYAVFDPGRE